MIGLAVFAAFVVGILAGGLVAIIVSELRLFSWKHRSEESGYSSRYSPDTFGYDADIVDTAAVSISPRSRPYSEDRES